jgi:hypothetical protein
MISCYVKREKFFIRWATRIPDSSLSIGVGYRQDGPGSIPLVQDLSLLHSVQTGSGAHPAFYPMGTGSSLQG